MQSITSFLADCFDKIDKLDNISTIGLSALGTGGLRYQPADVAKAIKHVGETKGPKLGLKAIIIAIRECDTKLHTVLSKFICNFKSRLKNFLTK